MNYAVMDWWIADKENRWEKQRFTPIENGYKGIYINLKGGESKNILGDFGFKPDPEKKNLRLPIEIVIDRVSGKGSRSPLSPSLKDKFSSISGFTIIMKYEPAGLNIKVVDKKGKPDPVAVIQVETTNGLQKESIRVNKNGEIILKSIKSCFICRRICFFYYSGVRQRDSEEKTRDYPF